MKRSGALWGALLIFIGLIWILGSTNTVNIDIFGAISTLWPIFIIAAGITCFLKRESHLQRVILWVLVFAIIGGYGFFLGLNEGSPAGVHKTFEMKSNYRSASLVVNTGAANFNIGASGKDLADVQTNIKGIRFDIDEGASPKIEYSQKIQFGVVGRRQSFRADLYNAVPWNIELNTGSISGSLNLRELQVESLTINAGACDLDIVAGDKTEDSRIVINGGVVKLKVDVPDNVGLKVSSGSAVTNVNGNISMLKDGGVYRSENFESSSKKLYLEISSGAANISVNR